MLSMDAKDYKQKADLAFARKSALNEISALVDFNLPAEEMREEITRILAECKAAEQAAIAA